LDYELANAACQRIRRHRTDAAGVLALLSLLPALGISRVEVPPLAAATLANQTGLSAYDASYLWLAMARDAELVTLDRRLADVNQRLREPFSG
jgi:predicted nucleic acid-binding protein